MAASAETIAQAESLSFHATHSVVRDASGSQVIAGGIGFWVDEYAEGENAMDVFWGTKLIGSLGLSSPQQHFCGSRPTMACFVWVHGDGFTTDYLDEAVLYMAGDYEELGSAPDPEVIDHPQVVEGLPQAIREVIANMSAIECSELEDAIVVTHRDMIDVSPEITDYIFGSRPMEILDEIQARTFTYAQAKTAIVELQRQMDAD